MVSKVSKHNLEIALYYLFGVALLLMLAFDTLLPFGWVEKYELSIPIWQRPLHPLILGTGIIAAATFVLPTIFLIRRYPAFKSEIEEEILADFAAKIALIKMPLSRQEGLNLFNGLNTTLHGVNEIHSTFYFVRTFTIGLLLLYLPNLIDIGLSMIFRKPSP